MKLIKIASSRAVDAEARLYKLENLLDDPKGEPQPFWTPVYGGLDDGALGGKQVVMDPLDLGALNISAADLAGLEPQEAGS